MPRLGLKPSEFVTEHIFNSKTPNIKWLKKKMSQSWVQVWSKLILQWPTVGWPINRLKLNILQGLTVDSAVNYSSSRLLLFFVSQALCLIFCISHLLRTSQKCETISNRGSMLRLEMLKHKCHPNNWFIVLHGFDTKMVMCLKLHHKVNESLCCRLPYSLLN